MSLPVSYAELARTPRRRRPGDPVPLAGARAAVLELRRGKGMVLDPETRTPGAPASSPTR